MTSVTTKPELSQPSTDGSSQLFCDWFDPIEACIRERVRELIEEMIRSELDAVLSRPRYGRRAGLAEDSDGTAVANNPQQSWGFEGEPPEAVMKDSATRDGDFMRMRASTATDPTACPPSPDF